MKSITDTLSVTQPARPDCESQSTSGTVSSASGP